MFFTSSCVVVGSEPSSTSQQPIWNYYLAAITNVGTNWQTVQGSTDFKINDLSCNVMLRMGIGRNQSPPVITNAGETLFSNLASMSVDIANNLSPVGLTSIFPDF